MESKISVSHTATSPLAVLRARPLAGGGPRHPYIGGSSPSDRPIDHSKMEMTSIVVAMEAIRRQTYSIRVVHSESLVRMNDSRVLRSMPVAGIF